MNSEHSGDEAGSSGTRTAPLPRASKNRETLDALVARLKEKQLPADMRIGASMAVTRFIAALPASSRVFARGEVRNPEKDKWYPAVLTYNSVSRQTRAWAPSGRKLAMEPHHQSFFWNLVPHEGIAREVLCHSEDASVVAA